ncbi:MAG: DUF2087 domain-containing protein [Clostridia bacterium]|nr:DUF2087 domain-containing protein [Clostridia bacterium]
MVIELNEQEIFEEVKNFLNAEGQIKNWPSKQLKKMEVVRYLSTKFEKDRNYSEQEVNAIIESWHTFNDYFILRRSLIEMGYMNRTKNGSSYWRT